MKVTMDELAADLAAESAALRALLAPLDERGWSAPTPSPGWSVKDQISHLAYFDDIAVRSATEPDAFREELRQVVADGGISPDEVAERYRSRNGVELLTWFDEARARLIAEFGSLDPALRVPWFGPEMSAASALTARIMETWAHGQDVADTVGAQREPTDRLRHVAHLGIAARPFSYAVRGREAPTAPVRVELVAPSGASWTWGPDDADDRVTGPALDFCLAVTQRRHRDDTALVIIGPVAAAWMSIAQAFAGTAGSGRAAGQFT